MCKRLDFFLNEKNNKHTLLTHTFMNVLFFFSKIMLLPVRNREEIILLFLELNNNE
jgi:hypothetical protein